LKENKSALKENKSTLKNNLRKITQVSEKNIKALCRKYNTSA
jgi:hypothetical protein